MSTTTTKKITSVAALNSAIEALSGMGFDAEVVDKLVAIRTSYEKKADAAKGKNSTKGAENAAIGEQIVAEMEADKTYTLSDMMHFDCLVGMELTTAKVRAFLESPMQEQKIRRGVFKGRVVYSLSK